MTLPFMWALIALNRWMNCPGLTPCAPRAGPIGGAGVAVPPGAWSLNCLVISFLAMIDSPKYARGQNVRPQRPTYWTKGGNLIGRDAKRQGQDQRLRWMSGLKSITMYV